MAEAQGLPLMRPAFAGHTVATLLFAGTILVWVLMELRQGLKSSHRGGAIADRGSITVIRLLGGLAGLIAVLAITRARASAFDFSPLVVAMGLTLAWGGLALRWWSFHTLGRYFTFRVMTSSDQPVIQDGPYRWLRHPSYTGILLILAGIGVVYGNWIALAALVVGPLIGIVYRIHVEEAALTLSLGAAYTDFARSRKRIIPFVW